jgi:hypothetical protein
MGGPHGRILDADAANLRLLDRVLAEPEGRALEGLVAAQFLAGTLLYSLVEE